MSKILMLSIKILMLSFYLLKEEQILPITKTDYEKGIKPQKIIYNKHIVKKGIILKYCKFCKPFKDNANPDDFFEYEYQGEFLTVGLSVIKKVYYNDEEYLIVNKKTCSVSTIPGKPFLFDSFIICANDGQTTDKKYFIEIWQFRSNKLYKLERIYLKEQTEPINFHLLKNRIIAFKNINGLYFKLNRSCYH
ncbi:hypothetical protein MUY27_17170 [Mucilaginibacter sp. RS28]|uniref:Uncharacterized protein n=1 Tax=Mucilaginibacter straminoryzae TaxID=2932774 RepID=A0A9X1X848_9SPHI|nr:hypothetical protein [Mucilaginibacter straminoryzae]MCJ8211453.1 hypothetical protein [Mucilaginibacter straminoryzae]